MNRKTDDFRHILALSGGKDSAALAVYLKDKIPDLEYVFLDTGHELPETYEFLHRMRAILGMDIKVIKPKRNFDFWLGIFNGCLPSPKNRWCTRELKIEPYEKYLGASKCISYIAIRSDEDRTGYISSKQNIIPRYPFIKDDITRSDVIQILEDSGLGLPEYYKWRSRSGCYFCFFQRLDEYVALSKFHPNLFERACAYESNHSDGRTYTWCEGISLKELVEKRPFTAGRQTKKVVSNRSSKDKRLSSLLAPFSSNIISLDHSLKTSSVRDVKDTEANDEVVPCLICTL